MRPAAEAVAGAVARTPDAAGKVFDFDIDATARARIDRGVGLGLAIVDEIADAYSATVTFERADLGGLAVRIMIPG
jgi:K+-sensing histidine kinase KdpD